LRPFFESKIMGLDWEKLRDLDRVRKTRSPFEQTEYEQQIDERQKAKAEAILAETNAIVEQALERCKDSPGETEFILSLQQGLFKYGSLTARQRYFLKLKAGVEPDSIEIDAGRPKAKIIKPLVRG
jgi:phage protein D